MRRKFQSLIAIIGDSWGCGEWNFVPGVDGATITHTGLEQYLLEDDHKVINLSRSSNQNFESIESLEKYLQESTVDLTTVFWVVTCPLRWPGGTIYNSPTEFGIQQLTIVFEYAECLAEKYNLTIYALGGLCDIPDEIVQKQFNRIKIAIPSISSLLIENFPKSMFGEIKEIHHIKIKELAVDVMNKIEKKMNVYRSAEQYFPDHGHPNRDVHYKIFKQIKQYL